MRKHFGRVLWVILAVLFAVSAASAAPDGIWRDQPESPMYNFYIQTYSQGSILVIVASGVEQFWVFLDSNAADGVNVSQDLSGASHALIIDFTGDNSAQVQLTFEGEVARNFSIFRAFQAPLPGTGAGNPFTWRT